MSTKVTFNVCDEDLEYARSVWDSADFVLGHVNELLKQRGIDIKFEVENHGWIEDMPEKYWNEDLDDYNGSGIEIVETLDSNDDMEDFGVL
jgi:hypothetical protein